MGVAAAVGAGMVAAAGMAVTAGATPGVGVGTAVWAMAEAASRLTRRAVMDLIMLSL